MENDVVEVHAVSLDPEQTLPDHRGLARVVYSLSDYRVRLTHGESSEEHSFERGDVHRRATGVHSLENVGDQPARLIVVEFLD